jgi:hypothetical protein
LGAKTPVTLRGVLVNQSAETIATLDANLVLLGRRHH